MAPGGFLILRRLIAGVLAAGAGLLTYGALVEAHRLVQEHRTLHLPHWPSHLNGYRIGLISDLHIRAENRTSRLRDAISFLVDADPDTIVIAGDIVERWGGGVAEEVQRILEPLSKARGSVLVIPGNHDYYFGDAAQLRPLLEDLGLTYLVNQAVFKDGINWVGIDCALEGEPKLYETIRAAQAEHPIVLLWHEPDVVDFVPKGPELMLAGHSHGGQFTTPWGWAPMTSDLGSKYLRGFFPHAAVPLYVSRGLATTGPPSRLFCPPEVAILTLQGPQALG